MTNFRTNLAQSAFSIERNPVVFQDFTLESAFQPILSPSHQRVVGYEALARPRRGNESVSPGVLFSAAAADGQEPMLDLQLWSQCLEQYARASPNAWLFLNLSGASVESSLTSPTQLARVVRDAGVSCDRVVLEVVEEEISDDGLLSDFVSACKAEGFRLAIDDFGAGDAHFERVWRLGPDIVKMDRAMVVHAAGNDRACRLFLSLIKLIRENGSLVLIEGIETEAQARIAWHSDADFYQGFWYSHPQDSLKEPVCFADQIRQCQREFDALNIEQVQKHNAMLRLLRIEVLDACHRMAARQTLAEATETLLDVPGVKRCYLLDTQGKQEGDTVSARAFSRHASRFNPLTQSRGASWAYRDYFIAAIRSPQLIHLSRPYVALPDTVRTVTISHVTFTGNGNRVLCVDLHVDEAFPGANQTLPMQL